MEEQMEERIRQLERRLAQEQQLREREREREHQLLEREQQRREAAENAARSALRLPLHEFLRHCHILSKHIRPITDKALTTKGDATNPAKRLYPKHILQWPEFAQRQRAVWETLYHSDRFRTERLFPSSTQLEYVQRLIDPIGSEQGLRYFERDTVENMVTALLDEVAKDEALCEELGLDGKVTFESHANFGLDSDDDGSTLVTAMQTLSEEGNARTVTPRKRNRRADQFCIYRRSADGANEALLGIEYKAPHKVTQEEVSLGLRTDLCLEEDIFGNNSEEFPFLCQYLMAAVVTQLFSYMIDIGLRYGYVCTGEAFLFLHIPLDPTKVYCSVNIPNRDCETDGADSLERTAVAQVFAFILQALVDEPADQAWRDAARANLRTWKIEVIDVLSMIPITMRTTRDHSTYQPSEWAPSVQRSPIPLRYRCRPEETRAVRDNEEDSGGDADEAALDPQSPSHRRVTRSQTTATKPSSSKKSDTSRRGRSTGADRKKRIKEQPYCSHECLAGLAQGAPLDLDCANVKSHGKEHIKPGLLLELVQEQLATDRGRDADCCPLYMHGSRGALLKIRLTSHGYTLVGKAVESSKLRYLQHEKRVYDHIHDLQGLTVPVCLGMINLACPYYYSIAELEHVMLLSWAGCSLLSPIHAERRANLVEPVRDAYQRLHSRGVLHEDPALRNILIDQAREKVMLVDFERSKLPRRQALSELSPYRKRKRATSSKLVVTDEMDRACKREISKATKAVLG
ncbi:hypothetical protein FH972_024059 [Carpinus fangiana]|uniref:Protein kinase domain-containing protein n=1 Tax=Carpinus fangiana TaxID=176857 RepID=A0A5N6KX88_9ROSI|nr:hypothetical protein FH972_024059 [Carpinus fangiana]